MPLTGSDRHALRQLATRRRHHRQADAELTHDERHLVLYLRTREDPPGPALLREIADELGVHVSRVAAIEDAARRDEGDPRTP